jgi:hypothetical protein
VVQLCILASLPACFRAEFFPILLSGIQSRGRHWAIQ